MQVRGERGVGWEKGGVNVAVRRKEEMMSVRPAEFGVFIATNSASILHVNTRLFLVDSDSVCILTRWPAADSTVPEDMC